MGVIKESAKLGVKEFPLHGIESTIKEWWPHEHLNEFFIGNTALDPLLNVLHGGRVDFNTLCSRNSPHRDHIFPKSKLEKRSVPEDKINHYANMRLLGAIPNILKSDEERF